MSPELSSSGISVIRRGDLTYLDDSSSGICELDKLENLQRSSDHFVFLLGVGFFAEEGSLEVLVRVRERWIMGPNSVSLFSLADWRDK